ncbi:MAG: hypothetical protein G8345_04415 [Magnetococcales bacterium]|nr:hypothetical protein [Magnetococcales bacterium]NGZ26115.1 hypothetical protein [Magnetococcales bacterium]
MALHLLLEGLMAEGDPAMEEVCPTVDRLAAHGDTGRLFLCQGERLPEEGGCWFTYFGQQQGVREADLPTGFFAALGAGLAPDPQQTWAMLSFTNLYRKQDKLLFLSPLRTGQSVEECQALADGLAEEFAAEGWQVITHPHSTTLFCHSSQRFNVRTTPLAILEGEDSFIHLPTGEDYRPIHQLLTIGQLLMARHPVNTTRKLAGRLPLNTPWLQGIAPGPAMMVTGKKQGVCWCQDLLVAGLAKAAGMRVNLLPEGEALPALPLDEIADQAAHGLAVVHLQGPAVLARHQMTTERLELLARMDQEIFSTLGQELATRQTSLTLITPSPLTAKGLGSNAPACWLTVEGKAMGKDRRFWNRRRFGEGELLDMGALTDRWQ